AVHGSVVRAQCGQHCRETIHRCGLPHEPLRYTSIASVLPQFVVRGRRVPAGMMFTLAGGRPPREGHRPHRRRWRRNEITVAAPREMRRSLAGAAVGNFMEWYDFGVYAY